MRMRQHLADIFKVFSNDETLLRLLYYKPSNALDNPLDSSKPDVLSLDNKWDIINDRILFTPTYNGLDTEPKCRICFYPGARRPNSNWLIADQYIKIDVLTHADFNNVDLRLSWICDHINDLMFDQQITGAGSVQAKAGKERPSPENYIGYELVYEIGSFNK